MVQQFILCDVAIKLGIPVYTSVSVSVCIRWLSNSCAE